MRQVLADFDELARVEVGPAPPLADGETLGTVSTRLTGAVEAFEDAPFTVQRLAELLLEPQKQYSRLDKLVCACAAMMQAGCRCEGLPSGMATDVLCCLRPGAGAGEAAAGNIHGGADSRAASCARARRAAPSE